MTGWKAELTASLRISRTPSPTGGPHEGGAVPPTAAPMTSGPNHDGVKGIDVVMGARNVVSKGARLVQPVAPGGEVVCLCLRNRE
jgi:hypothetical protein